MMKRAPLEGPFHRRCSREEAEARKSRGKHVF